MNLAVRDEVALQALVEAEYGWRVAPSKLASAVAAAWPQLNELAIGDLDALQARLRAHDQSVWDCLIPHLTVRETYFLRAPRQLERFRRVALPELGARAAARGTPLRLLSAGCATGEEVYSLAILAAEAGLAVEAYGMDIDRRALVVAKQGEYGLNSFRGVEASWRDRHFEPTADGRWRVLEKHRERTRWFPGNLVKMGLNRGWGQFDAVFCRNVLIYFDRGTQAAVVMQLRRLVMPGGLLFFGHSEILLDRMGDLGLTFCETNGAYRRREA